jgi:hypothetical protein
MVLLCLPSCRPQPLEQALKGELPPAESNTVIMEYCQSCHIHRAFHAEGHAARVGPMYDRPPYTATAQCRVCHLVDEDTWGKATRKTLWPAEVAENRFRAWEKRLLSEKPVTTMPAGTSVRKRQGTQ